MQLAGSFITFQIHEHKPGSVPEFVAEVPVTINTVLIQFDIPTLSGKSRQRKPQRIGAVLFHDFQRINHVAFGLAHFLPLCVTNQGMNINVAKRHIVHEFDSHHDHACHPEKQNVKPGTKNRCRIKLFQGFRFFRPA